MLDLSYDWSFLNMTEEIMNERVLGCPAVEIKKETSIALMRDDVAISLVTSKRGLVVMVSREYLRNIGNRSWL